MLQAQDQIADEEGSTRQKSTKMTKGKLAGVQNLGGEIPLAIQGLRVLTHHLRTLEGTKERTNMIERNQKSQITEETTQIQNGEARTAERTRKRTQSTKNAILRVHKMRVTSQRAFTFLRRYLRELPGPNRSNPKILWPKKPNWPTWTKMRP